MILARCCTCILITKLSLSRVRVLAVNANLDLVHGNEKIAHKTTDILTNDTDKDLAITKYIARDGLTPASKCIRTRFFRKHFDVPFEEIRDIEDEMADILNKIKQQKKEKGGKRSTSKKSQDQNPEEDIEAGSEINEENGDPKFSFKITIRN